MSDQTPAWRSPRAWTVLLVVALLGLASDLGTKSLAFAKVAAHPVVVDREQVLMLPPEDIGSLVPDKRVTVIPSVLDFTLVLNPGAVFGLGAGKRWFFIIFTGAAAALCVWMFATWTGRRDHWAHSAIGLVLAGGAGNLYDRIRFACVRDFIDPLPGVQLPFGLAWPGGETEAWPWVSNVADAYLIVGIAVLLFLSFKPQKADRVTGASPGEAAASETAAADSPAPAEPDPKA